MVCIAMYSIVQDLSRYRERIIEDAVNTFKDTKLFSGQDTPSADLARVVSEGLLDLLMEPEESQDLHTLRRYMEWLFNLMRKGSVKTDTTINFLDTFAEIVKRPLNNKEDADVDSFFALCKDIVEQRHKELAR